jgi:molecular chaperone GrpE
MNKAINKPNPPEISQLKSQLARALADYDNLRKRVEREKETFEKIANLNLVIKLLPVLETLRRAQSHLKDEGLGITIKEFEDSLGQEGIEEIKVSKGDPFNPLLHEAIEVTGEGEKGKVSEVLAPGWRFSQGPVIRHAQVKVSK